ncbi:PaaI family thioesterase [Diaphorobacter ruginosibacter]|uniref:PaaI family thioesterase n=1 Tax=Diaphorobacter ruginosibacter TaxID=1715720 RepID=A0A7G9RUK6_9BURK|nr:PaaI family thioesterase [Diaphorobacter ruginosibacter]QNN59281.1 PaaI family thioesterase [Diaphorobacter ruginosibacter]
MSIDIVEAFNKAAEGTLPGMLGMRMFKVEGDAFHLEMPVRPELMAPNGYLHAGSLVTLADTACGYGCRARVPKEATGFTTIELKSNHLGTARDGTVECVATPVHLGRNTHVWDAVVRHRETGKTLVMFRCTQMVLYPRP